MNIVFTSCMDARRMPVQPVWRAIADENPDVLALLGDQIYMDWAERPDWRQRLGGSGAWSDAHANVLHALPRTCTRVTLRSGRLRAFATC